MIARLSELLRHTIEARGADEVPLRDELEFLRRYIEIMEIRFQGRLTVTVNAGERSMEALVPNLILQPSTGQGVGLTNTKARLDQLYGDPASLTLTSPSAGGVLATLRVPYHTAADLRTRATHA